MSMTNFDKNVNIISSLSDEPNSSDGLTADELKAKFDAAVNLIKDYINNTQNVGIDAALALKADKTYVDGRTVDYITAYGCPNNIWYQKFNSGVIKCWLNNSTTYTGSTPTALMGGYLSYIDIDMPVSSATGWTGVASGRLGTGYGFAFVEGLTNNTIRVVIFGTQNSNSIALTGLDAYGRV